MLKEIAEQPERLRDALIGKANTVQGNITLFAFLQYDKKLKKLLVLLSVDAEHLFFWPTWQTFY